MIISVNGIGLNYEETGVGKIMIFLHGNGQDTSMFSEAVRYFEGEYKCVCVDSRGHGKSEWGCKELTIPMLADDIIAFIEMKGYDDVALIGFSDGGNIALEVAASSGRVKEVVAVGANLYPKGLTPFILFSANLTRALCLPFSFIKKVRDTRRIYRLMTHQPEITAEKLSKITAKTLVVAGTKDMIKTDHTKEIASKIPSAELKLFENADHFLFEKNSEELLSVIKEFMEGDGK